MTDTLRSRLEYEPVELQFGTSGRRGAVVHLTQLEIYINALAELEYLQSLSLSEGGIIRGDPFFFALDLRPSSSRFVESQGGRGEIAQAIVRAIFDAGMHPVNLGLIPTPALMHYAVSRRKGSIMVTGSHIPFERNGYKVNTSRGELLKKDEGPVGERVAQVRIRVYGRDYRESPFNAQGMLKTGHQELPPEDAAARQAYLDRYTNFFKSACLSGFRLVCYQHSAVGRDVLVEILDRLGAQTFPAGRSDSFIPIDTENIDDAQLNSIQDLADRVREKHGPIDAVVSTDGDSDRPLLLGVAPDSGRLTFFSGDLVGMVAAEYLRADAVIVPISCNDGIDRGKLSTMLEPKTRIGSPYVIEAMERASQKGKRSICGWEANGGFLLGSDLEREGRRLAALPTRDAVLPILCALSAAREKNATLNEIFAQLPKRFSRAALLRQFPRPRALALVRHFSPGDPRVREVSFEKDRLVFLDESGAALQTSAAERQSMETIRRQLEHLFPAETGRIARLNYVDGLRIIFASGDVAHVRPSGNADELRIYAAADTQARADEIARLGVAEPDGLLRKMDLAAQG